jgi:hypothetical protein
MYPSDDLSASHSSSGKETTTVGREYGWRKSRGGVMLRTLAGAATGQARNRRSRMPPPRRRPADLLRVGINGVSGLPSTGGSV